MQCEGLPSSHREVRRDASVHRLGGGDRFMFECDLFWYTRTNDSFNSRRSTRLGFVRVVTSKRWRRFALRKLNPLNLSFTVCHRLLSRLSFRCNVSNIFENIGPLRKGKRSRGVVPLEIQGVPGVGRRGFIVHGVCGGCDLLGHHVVDSRGASVEFRRFERGCLRRRVKNERRKE